MNHRDTSQPPKSDDPMTPSRRRFVQGSVAAAMAGVLGLPHVERRRTG